MFPVMWCLSCATKQHYMVLPFRFLGGGEGVKVDDSCCFGERYMGYSRHLLGKRHCSVSNNTIQWPPIRPHNTLPWSFDTPPRSHGIATFTRKFTGKIPMQLQSRTYDIKNNTRKSATLYANLQVKSRRQEQSGTSDLKTATRQNTILYSNLQEKCQ